MKNNTKIFAAIIICLLAISCSNDDEKPETQPEVHLNLLLKTTDSDDGLTSIYTYDNNNRLVNYKRNGTANNPAKDQNFAYNADGTLNKITEAANNSIVSEFFYDSNKKIIKQIGRNGIDLYTYVYNGNTITVNYRFTTTNSGWREVYSYDEKGNMTEGKSYTEANDVNPEGKYSGVINYTYDDKKNANSSLPYGFYFPASVNNIKTTQYNGGEIGSSQYEYNADDYPTKRTDSYTRLYEYKRL